MKARYLGHPALRDESPKTVGFAGKTFVRGVFRDISDIDAKLLGKMRGNPAFEVSEDALTDDEQAAAEAAELTAVPPTAQGAAGPNPGSLDKAALLARLTALAEKHPEVEITFSDRMGEPKLRSVLEGAQFEIGDED